jgi:hypothetical protein
MLEEDMEPCVGVLEPLVQSILTRFESPKNVAPIYFRGHLGVLPG